MYYINDEREREKEIKRAHILSAVFFLYSSYAIRESAKNSTVCFGSQDADRSIQLVSHSIKDTVLSVDPSVTSKLRHVRARPSRVIMLRAFATCIREVHPPDHQLILPQKMRGDFARVYLEEQCTIALKKDYDFSEG